MVVADNNSGDIYNWLSRELGYTPLATTTLGVLDEKDELIMAVSYFKKGASCLLSAAAKNAEWCKPETLTKLLRVPFDDLNCKVARFEISVKNKRANRFCKGIGCVKEGLLRFAHHDNTHQVVWSLTKKEISKKGWYRYGKQGC